MSKISITLHESGLSPDISLINSSTLVEDFSGVMVEKLNTKSYWYEFTEAVGVDYIFTITAPGYEYTDVLFYETSGGSGGGATPEQIWTYADRTVTNAGGGGGGTSINYSAITGPIRTLGENLSKELDILKNNDKEIYDKIIAKEDFSDMLDAIDIPEVTFEEKEAKKLVKSLEKLDKKVSTYIESEKKEKDEIGAIASEFTRLEMEDAKNEKEKEIEKKRKEEEEKKIEEENDKKLLEEIKAEFDTQEEQEKEEKKKELEKELEETLKEADEIKKELNSIK